MITISDAARAAVAAGATIATKFDVLRAGSVVAADLGLDDAGKVTVDGTASVTRSADVSISDVQAMLPLTPTSKMAPFGNEIALYSGVVLPAGTPITNANQTTRPDGRVLERWPVGVFGIDEPNLAESAASLTLTVKLFDRAMTVASRRLSNVYTVAAGTAYVTAAAGPGGRPGGAIADLIDTVFPGLIYSFVGSTATTPALVFAELDDPWAKAQDMAQAIGKRLFFDPSGVCTLADTPDPNVLITVFDYSTGASGLLETLQQTLSPHQSYSHAIVIGEPLDGTAPVRSDVYDTDPTSPTYYLGPFGNRPTMLRSPLVRTQAQADDACAALLLRSKGAMQMVQATAVPVTAHEAYDAVRVSSPRSGLASVPFLMEKFAFPIGPAGSMDVTFRGRRI